MDMPLKDTVKSSELPRSIAFINTRLQEDEQFDLLQLKNQLNEFESKISFHTLEQMGGIINA